MYGQLAHYLWLLRGCSAVNVILLLLLLECHTLAVQFKVSPGSSTGWLDTTTATTATEYCSTATASS